MPVDGAGPIAVGADRIAFHVDFHRRSVRRSVQSIGARAVRVAAGSDDASARNLTAVQEHADQVSAEIEFLLWPRLSDDGGAGREAEDGSKNQQLPESS